MSVSFFFSDVEDSTGLLARIGPDYARVLEDARELVRDAVAQAGGREVDSRGDELFCVFEEAPRGCRRRARAQRAFGLHVWPNGEQVRVRIGLHSGDAESQDGGYFGLDVHRAARICQAGHGGQVLASAEAAGLSQAATRELGEFEFKGLREPERIFQLVADDLQTSFRRFGTCVSTSTHCVR